MATGRDDGKRRTALVIVNAAGGSAGQPVDAAMDRLRRHGIEPDLVRPDDPKQISPLIRERGPDADLIVMGGGDGTISRSAEALLDAGRPVGLLPLGTANDLARTLGLPLQPADAATVIGRGHTTRIDLGTVNNRPFFNVASLGFSARVAAYHDGARKRRLKLLSYPVSWFEAQRDTVPFRLELQTPDKTIRSKSTLVAVGNGVHFGGGLKIAPDAAIDDGWLDVFYVKPVGPLAMLRLVVLLRVGALRRRRDVRTLRVRELTLDADPQQQINVDGELLEETPARFGMLREALEVFVPHPK